MATQTHHETGNVIAFAPRRTASVTIKREGSVVQFDAMRMAALRAPVVDYDAWYHQAEVEGASRH